MDGLTPGRVVHYVMPDGHHRPAVVLHVWGETGLSNLMVLTDGSNDLPYTPDEKTAFQNFGMVADEVRHGHVWRTSISFSEQPVPGTWHWIEKA